MNIHVAHLVRGRTFHLLRNLSSYDIEDFLATIPVSVSAQLVLEILTHFRCLTVREVSIVCFYDYATFTFLKTQLVSI